jgi:hypothetical protein
MPAPHLIHPQIIYVLAAVQVPVHAVKRYIVKHLPLPRLDGI